MATDRLRPAYCHRGGEVPLLGVTLDAHLREVVESHREREALVSVHQGVRWTYGELDARVQRVAAGLVALGIGRGDRVGVWSPDAAEWVLLQLATARVGALLVNVNPAWKAAELAHALERARVEALFLAPSFRRADYVAIVRELCPELDRVTPEAFASERFPELRTLVVFDPGHPADTARPASGLHTWPELLDLGRTVEDERVAAEGAGLDPDDPINIQFTSGTTGFPKPVVLTHHNILNNAWFSAAAMGFTERDRLCVPVPFYHCFGMVVSTLVCLTHGAALVIPAPHFEAGATLAAIAGERCTAVHGVPTMFVEELEHPDFDRYDLASLRTGIMAGAPCPPELVRRVMERMGCRAILIGYGQTEASPITHLTRADDPPARRVDTVGTNLAHTECKVVDPSTGRTLAIDQPGEVCFRGYHVMRGYFEDPETTARAIDEAGWLHSGDLGVMDAEGYLAIAGRLKDIVIRGGENIDPAEVEAVLFEHDAVADAAVVGVPDARMGEELGAWVRLHAGASATPEELREHVRDRVAHYKVPRYVWLVDELPTTVTGKVKKFEIRETIERWSEEGRLAEADFVRHSTRTAGSRP